MGSPYFSFISYTNPTQAGYPYNSYTSYDTAAPWFTYNDFNDEIASLVEYYVNLLILQYVGLPKARSTIAAWVEPAIMGLLGIQVQNAYEIGTAVGPQLDVIGKYVGAVRSGYGPNGPITLDDADFTTFIELCIVNNNSTASLASIQSLLHTYFNEEILVFDYLNMRLSYYVSSTGIDSNLAILFVTEGKLPKPLGVQLASVIYAPYDTLISFFGCRTYTAPAYHVSPLNSYVSYQLDYPWLSYTDALIV